MTLSMRMAAFFAAAFMAGDAAAATFAGNVSGLSPQSRSWSWNGGQLNGFRAALEDRRNFGPTGTSTVDTIDTVDLTTIDAGTLADVDVFVAGWWHEADSATHQQALVDWFRAGGNLWVLADDPIRDGLLTDLGLQTLSGSQNPSLVTGTLADGSFGAPGQVQQRGNVGHFDNASITALGGEVFATNALDQATAAGFERGTFGTGSGRLLIFSDIDMITSYGGADYATMNGNARLGLNGAEYLLSQPAPVPLPAGLPLLLAGLGAFAVVRRAQTPRGA